MLLCCQALHSIPRRLALHSAFSPQQLLSQLHISSTVLQPCVQLLLQRLQRNLVLVSLPGARQADVQRGAVVLRPGGLLTRR